MTDHPRFEPMKGNNDNAHRHHYGGSLADFVFRVVAWTTTKPERAAKLDGRLGSSISQIDRGRLSTKERLAMEQRAMLRRQGVPPNPKAVPWQVLILALLPTGIVALIASNQDVQLAANDRAVDQLMPAVPTP